MPFADNAGIRIHYEIDGAGPPLVLQHGFTNCLGDWKECGYVLALRRDYQLLLVDARGHGASDKPHNAAAYGLEQRVVDVTAVLDAARIGKAHFWGYSMGGWIGFGMAKYAPHRLSRLVIGGHHPFARDQSGFRQWLRVGIDKGPDALVAAFESMAGPVSKSYADRLRAADLHAWLACVEDRASLEDVLSTMTMPCFLYAGEADPAFEQMRAASRSMPNAEFFALPELSHVQAFVAGEQILPRVAEFLGGKGTATDRG